MTDARPRRRALAAAWLVLMLATGAAVPGHAFAQDASADPAADASDPASPASPDPGAGATAAPSDPGDAAPGAAFARAVDAASIPIRADVFATGFDAPVYLADDGVEGKSCLYVVERGGKIKIVEADGRVRVKPFLDLGPDGLDVVFTGPEQGLHSIAFHPKFRKNGRFFVHYNAQPDGKSSVIAEFRGKPCKPANNKPVKPSVITVPQPYPNDNAGWIGFGPDGFLYIPLGDGGGPAPGDPDRLGQAASTRLAKVLRINVNKGKLYAVPRDNPYPPKKTKGFAPETWARGLRDPRRASFDDATGDLWIGDAGQTISEVNRIPAGVADLNFGWSEVEGASTCHPSVPDCDPSRFEPPVFEYEQLPPQRAITGGYVYRGQTIPDLDGIYLFADFASGSVWGLDADAVAASQPAAAGLLLEEPQGFVSFGEDDAGELYLVSLDGSIYRINAEES